MRLNFTEAQLKDPVYNAEGKKAAYEEFRQRWANVWSILTPDERELVSEQMNKLCRVTSTPEDFSSMRKWISAMYE